MSIFYPFYKTPVHASRLLILYEFCQTVLDFRVTTIQLLFSSDISSSTVSTFAPFLLSFVCRTLTTLTCVIAGTSTGASSPRTPWQPRRLCLQKSLWSQRRRIWSSPPCSRSSSAASELWLLSTTNRPVPLWRAAEGCNTEGFRLVLDRESLNIFISHMFKYTHRRLPARTGSWVTQYSFHTCLNTHAHTHTHIVDLFH